MLALRSLGEEVVGTLSAPSTTLSVVGVSGIEPETSSLSVTRSNHLSYTPVFVLSNPYFTEKSLENEKHCKRTLVSILAKAGNFDNPYKLYYYICTHYIKRNKNP